MQRNTPKNDMRGNAKIELEAQRMDALKCKKEMGLESTGMKEIDVLNASKGDSDGAQ